VSDSYFDEIRDPSCAYGWEPVESARLEALEEIRQRVADGWWPQKAYGSQPARWIRSGYGSVSIEAELASLLWSEDTSSET
jgi:hypothetical protein